MKEAIGYDYLRIQEVLMIRFTHRNIKYYVLLCMLIIINMIIAGCARKSENIPTAVQSVSNLVSEGWTAFQNGNYSKAIQVFERAIKRDVDPEISIDAYRGLGWTYARLEKFSQAVTNFNFVISLETVKTRKNPVFNLEEVIALAVSDTADFKINGAWQLITDQYIVSIEDVKSYSARISQKLGLAPAYIIEGGIRSINLPRTEISNAEGTAIGNALDHSIYFDPDSFKIPVTSPEEITAPSHYYLDAQKGIIEILPRIYDLEQISAHIQYHEKDYTIKRTEYKLIVLNNELENGDDTPPDSVSDIYYLKGNFYNKYRVGDETSGGTYYQADAFAGLASVYMAQGDYKNAIEAARALLYVNEDLKELDDNHYPYSRSLFDSDNEYDLWDFYKLLTICYYNIQDYLSAEKLLEVYLSQGDIIDNLSDDYTFQLVSKINELPDSAPVEWIPVNLW
jgi:tetratricopeptide (TPR) repeat protein